MEYRISTANGKCFLKIDPEIYSLDDIYASAYVFLDKCYILLDGDKEKEIVVRLRPKTDDIDPYELGEQFFNELINYSNYHRRSKSTMRIREIMLQRAILTNDPQYIQKMSGADAPHEDISESEQIIKNSNEAFDDSNDSIIDDPELKDIATPWDIRYGNKQGKKEKVNDEESKEKDKINYTKKED